MYGYIKGKVVLIDSSYIVIDNNGIGYLIYVPNPYSYQLDHEYKVYIYTKVSEEEFTLYGFKDSEQKELFLKLIDVKGLGPKMALPILATGTIDAIFDAIENENVNYLKKFPKIGDKVARQMILDLKGKLTSINTGIFAREDYSRELMDVLVGLGYKQIDIKRIIKKVDNTKSLEDQVKDALKLLLK